MILRRYFARAAKAASVSAYRWPTATGMVVNSWPGERVRRQSWSSPLGPEAAR